MDQDQETKQSVWEKTHHKAQDHAKLVMSQTLGFISSAFVLVAALAWNDAIRSLITLYFKENSGLISQFLYAILVTVIAVIITTRLSKLGEKLKDQQPQWKIS